MYMEVAAMGWTALEILDKLWMVLGFFWLLTAIGQKRAVFQESAARSAAYRIGTIVAFVLLFANWASVGPLAWHVTPEAPVLRWVALAVGIAGFVLAFWARILLGGEWSSSVTLKAGHRLIESGPYAFVRHPIYSGLLLAMVGTAIAGNELRMYLAVVVAFASWWYKSRLEERLLIHSLGKSYVEYRQRTYAMIPGLL
jgi:protein-S-isoprenylcysteine O-methyltransferase Ste14